MIGKTTEEAASDLGLTERKLANLLRKYPDLTPGETFGGMLVWNPEDVGIVRDHIAAVAEGICVVCYRAKVGAVREEE